MITDRLRRKSTSKKKFQIKDWYRILGTEISSYEELHCKTKQISEENELACVTMLDEIKDTG